MNELSSHRDYEEVINNGVALLDFNAPWCAPCRAQEPIMEMLAKHYAGKASIASMNIDNNRKTAGMLGIQSIPTLIIFKNGKEIQRFVGLQPKDLLIESLDKVIKCDT